MQYALYVYVTQNCKLVVLLHSVKLMNIIKSYVTVVGLVECTIIIIIIMFPPESILFKY